MLWVEEQHRRDFQQLRSEMQILDDRLSKGESVVTALEHHVAQLEQGHAPHQDSLAEMQLHQEDLENRGCRNNLRLWGLPEAKGPENLQETILAILHRVLDSDPLSIWNLIECTGRLGLSRLTQNANVMRYVACTAIGRRNKCTVLPGPRGRSTSMARKSPYFLMYPGPLCSGGPC